MSHFLRTLAQRTVAPPRESQLQPRLASRFESGPLPIADVPARQANGRAEMDAALPTRLVGPDPTARTPDSPSPAASATPGPRSNVNPVASTAPFSPTISPRSAVGSDNAFFASERKAALSPSGPSLTADRSASAQFASTLLVELANARAPTFTPTSPAGALAPSSEENTATQLRPRSGSAFTPPVAAIPVAAASAPATAPLPSAPSIRVHIGRVDIRAMHASPAPAPRPVPPERRPLLPLDVYLERRGSK